MEKIIEICHTFYKSFGGLIAFILAALLLVLVVAFLISHPVLLLSLLGLFVIAIFVMCIVGLLRAHHIV